MKRYGTTLTLLTALVLIVAAGWLGGGRSDTVASTMEQQKLDDIPALFETSDACMSCHNGLVTDDGLDVSIGIDWSTSMMANAARDPYWQAAVRREVTDFPSASEHIQSECSTCHMPMTSFREKAQGGQGQVFAHLPVTDAATHVELLAADGVSCTMCHSITAEGLGTEESFVGGFDVDTKKPLGERDIYGPYAVEDGRAMLMHSATGFKPVQSDHLKQSEFCATCHTLYTDALSPDGEVIGELPEQVPFLEWMHSSYVEEASCQTCHMPVLEDSMQISSVLGVKREGFSRHVFKGGNFFMQRILNRYRDELGTQALPNEMELAVARTTENLRENAARLVIGEAEVEDGRLRTSITVRNLTGHKLPTAYPSRRAWLHVTATDAAGKVLFESGRLQPNGAIFGNDNDDDASRYERHHDVVTEPGQVQIYEAILKGSDGSVTTGLLTAVDYQKDNRVLPRGFDKATAGPDIDVHGTASDDADFTGAEDTVIYDIDVGDAEGEITLTTELYYQPIGFRWAENLRPYDSFETDRFTRYYDEMSNVSAALLARAEIRVNR